MKKILGLFILVTMLTVPAMAFAGEQVGVYVAPKFIYGFTQMDGMKGNWFDAGSGDSGSDRIGSKTDSTFGGSIAIGYDFDKRFDVPIRAELEYAAFSKADGKRTFHDVDEVQTLKQTFGIQTLFLNAYWDINTGTKLTPYLGAGAGMAFINTKGKMSGYDPADPSDTFSHSFGSKTVTNFAWNVGAGVGYDLTDNWTIDAGYRFVGLGSVKTGTATDPGGSGNTLQLKTNNLYQHQVAVGVRYTF